MDHFTRSSLNGFSAHSIDRIHLKRRDEKWIREQLEGSNAQFIPLWQSKNLFAEEENPSPVLLSRAHLGESIDLAHSVTLLGEDGDRVYFAVDLPAEEDTPPSSLAELGKFQDLRRMSAQLGRRDGALLAYARGIAHWHRRNRFCGDCGSPTAPHQGGHVRICTNPHCGQQHFPRTDPAVIVLVSDGEYCLLGRQTVWPKAMYSAIAGFVEPGESLEDAVVREVMEETGIEVTEVHYRSSQPWPFPSSIMLGFQAKGVKAPLQLNDDELEDARWFTREDMREAFKEGTLRVPTPFSIAYRLIEDWYDAEAATPLKDLSGIVAHIVKG